MFVHFKHAVFARWLKTFSELDAKRSVTKCSKASKLLNMPLKTKNKNKKTHTK